MSQFLVSSDSADSLDPSDGWGEVPVEDRPLWSRYMVDHLPWFPGISIMALIAPGVLNGGTRAPVIWKQTAQDLHKAGFTPANYYLLAELLKLPCFRDELNEAKHGHLFSSWFRQIKMFTTFRLAGEAWKPWLERVANGESPRRSLERMLKGDDLPPLGSFTVGGVTHIATD